MGEQQYLSSLLTEVTHAVNDLGKNGISDGRKARTEALEAVRKLSTALTTPEEVILHHSFELPPLNMCVRIGVGMRIFHIIAEREPSATSSAELAEMTGGERSFIVRIMRIITAAGYAAEVGEESYSSNPLTTAMTAPAIEACIIHRYDYGLPVLSTAPGFFKSNGYRPPSEYRETPFQDAFKTDLGFYEYISQRPEAAKNFHSYMKSFQLRSPQWIDWFPIEKEILAGFLEVNKPTEDRVLLVEAGGGHGQNIKLFRDKFKHAPGRLVLQDLPRTLAGVDKLGDGIEVMEYDFFRPQPVQGARVYYFHFIFTDWSDEECIQILRNTASAMTPRYSILVLNEVVLPAENCPWQQATLDLIMMSSFSGRHRSQRRLQELLTAAGLEVTKFWYPPVVGDGVITAVRKQDEVDVRVRNPTYHSTTAQYHLPNDSIEYARLEDQAASLTEMMGTTVHAPLTRPSLIIDIGCGTGITTCQFGNLYPDAQVYGVDLSPVPSHTKPTNVEYIQGDIRELMKQDPVLRPSSLDFVFSRLLILGMTDWAGYVQDMASLLQPGGWIEMQDYDFVWYSHGKPISQDWGWVQAVFKAAKKKGLDLNCGVNIEKYMKQAGLVDVQKREFRLPAGTWDVEKRPETRRIGEHSAREYPMLYYHAIPKMLAGMGYSAEEIEGFREESKRCLAAEVGKEIWFYATVGRKPWVEMQEP